MTVFCIRHYFTRNVCGNKGNFFWSALVPFSLKKRGLILSLLLCCATLFAEDAWDITDQNLDGDKLNQILKTYITNVSNLIPDSTTLQNVWSYAPGKKKWWFGLGVNGSFTMLDQKKLSTLLDGGGGFGGSNMDLDKFPEGLPFLPAGSFDMRVGVKRVDLGITGMWITTDMFPALRNILGENSDFTYRTGGFDIRAAVIEDGKWFPLMPSVLLQAGYYFSWMESNFASGQSEKVSAEFRNDTYMFALQVSKEIPVLKPFIGGKLILSKTDTEFSWETERPAKVKGVEYPEGLSYHAGGNSGDLKAYFQVYGGLGITFIFKHVLTIGCAYNVVTGHFGADLSVRLLITSWD